MQIFDVTIPIHPNMVVWPGDPPISFHRVKKIEEGSNSNVSEIKMGVHTGTHVDAPVHFIQGKPGIDSLDLSILIGPAQVVELPDDCNLIDEKVVQSAGIKPGMERVLFKTKNSRFWQTDPDHFHTDFTAFSVNGSRAIISMGIRLLALDYLSISPYKQSRPTHEALLGANIIVVEGLDLSHIGPGFYQLICLPLRLMGSDGSPARVVLVQE